MTPIFALLGSAGNRAPAMDQDDPAKFTNLLSADQSQDGKQFPQLFTEMLAGQNTSSPDTEAGITEAQGTLPEEILTLRQQNATPQERLSEVSESSEDTERPVDIEKVVARNSDALTENTSPEGLTLEEIAPDDQVAPPPVVALTDAPIAIQTGPVGDTAAVPASNETLPALARMTSDTVRTIDNAPVRINDLPERGILPVNPAQPADGKPGEMPDLPDLSTLVTTAQGATGTVQTSPEIEQQVPAAPTVSLVSAATNREALSTITNTPAALATSGALETPLASELTLQLDDAEQPFTEIVRLAREKMDLADLLPQANVNDITKLKVGPVSGFVETGSTTAPLLTGQAQVTSSAAPLAAPGAASSVQTPAFTVQSPVQQVASAIINVAAQGDRVEVMLDPPELGRVFIDFNFSGDRSVSAIISAEASDTSNLMRKTADSLMQELNDAGFDSVNLSFAEHTEQQFSDDGRPSENNGFTYAPVLETVSHEVSQPTPTLLSVLSTDNLDLRL
ncbi:MAG: flagellar hook-length control protein FliK [Aquisalinus sp.]|nr:flagellar hook-length control protein FliK [Aquisalinus sp.]